MRFKQRFNSAALLALVMALALGMDAFASTAAGSQDNKAGPIANIAGVTTQFDINQTAVTEAATNINTGFTTNAGNHNPKALNEATRFKDAATITGTPPDNLMAVAVTQKNGTAATTFTVANVMFGLTSPPDEMLMTAVLATNQTDQFDDAAPRAPNNFTVAIAGATITRARGDYNVIGDYGAGVTRIGVACYTGSNSFTNTVGANAANFG